MQSLLNLHWEAKFIDKTILLQYEEGKENLFQIVKDRFSQLTSFSLIHRINPLKITVDLQKGLIYFNSKKQPLESNLYIFKKNIRLIYFRRNKIITNTNGAFKNHVIIYFLGYQYLNEIGRNKKVILQINQEGNILIGG